jgi:hypothetical protein
MTIDLNTVGMIALLTFFLAIIYSRITNGPDFPDTPNGVA